MTWLQRYRLAESLRSSMWLIPAGFMVVAIVLAVALEEVDSRVQLTLFDFSKDAAESVLGAISGSMITFTGFVFSTVMVALQFASSQISPRVLKTAFRDPRTKIALGTFVFTFTFALTASSDVTADRVPQLTLTVALLSVIASVAVFLAMVHQLSRDMRAANMLTTVGQRTMRVASAVYPDLVEDEAGAVLATTADPRPVTVVRSPRSGVVMAYDRTGMLALAAAEDCSIELVPVPGDFVAARSILFRVYGTPGDAFVEQLLGSIAIGTERTLEQDPAFGLRILVDAAIKALSPGINDPTTAVVALDQIHDVLSLISTRSLHTPSPIDRLGRPRLEIAQASWDDYVSLALDEIRHFGTGSVQVARRLRALLVDIADTAPLGRAQPLRDQLALLDSDVERGFAEEADRQRARIPDRQGLGGGHGSTPEWEQEETERGLTTVATNRKA